MFIKTMHFCRHYYVLKNTASNVENILTYKDYSPNKQKPSKDKQLTRSLAFIKKMLQMPCLFIS